MSKNENIEKISSIIRNKRIELKLSYQKLAEKTGLSKSTLQRYETGSIKNIPLDKLESISYALNIDPSFLLGWNSNKTEPETQTQSLSKQELNLLTNFNKLNDLGKNKLIEYSNDLSYNIKFINTNQNINPDNFASNFNEIIEVIHDMAGDHND